MDRDGIVGEPEDCRVCDGTTSDPDNDGVQEDIIYVSCATGIHPPGVDAADCGASTAPCATITHAWTAIADGSADGAEDYICFRNICAEENLSPAQGGGLTTDYAAPARGSEQAPWRYPRDPGMLIGWDVDGDRAYPPHDTDDQAILDGGMFTSIDNTHRAITLDVNDDYMEFAHFTARDYGRNPVDPKESDTGFFSAFGGAATSDFIYLHDIHLQNINRDRPNLSGVSAFLVFSAHYRWTKVENVLAENLGSWFARGASPADPVRTAGPLRFQNLSITAHGCNDPDFTAIEACPAGTPSTVTGFKIWGYYDAVDVLDSFMDANVSAWLPDRVNFFSLSACTQNVRLANNELRDVRSMFIGDAVSPTCEDALARPTGPVVIEQNRHINTHDWGFHVPIEFNNADSGVDPDFPNELFADIRIANNMIYSVTGFTRCIWLHVRHDTVTPTHITEVLHNSCYGDILRDAALQIGDGTDIARWPQNYRIQNNIFGGLGDDDLAVQTTHAPSGWTAAGNIYDNPNSRFVWSNSAELSLAQWQSASGSDTDAQKCTPIFEELGTGDLHLNGADTCALDRGVAVASISEDIDGDLRPQGTAPDIGADEIANSGPPRAAQADLQLSGRAGPSTVPLNGLVRVMLIGVNRGPETAPGATVNMTIPAGLTYLGNSCGAPAPTGGVWSWSLGNLPVNLGTRNLPRCLISLRSNSAGVQSISAEIVSGADDANSANNTYNFSLSVN